MSSYLQPTDPNKQWGVDIFLRQWDGTFGYAEFEVDSRSKSRNPLQAALRGAMDQAILYVDRHWSAATTPDQRRRIAYELLERVLRVDVGVHYGLVEESVEATDE